MTNSSSQLRIAALLALSVLVMAARQRERPGPASTARVAPPPSAGHALVFHDSLKAVLLVNAGLGGMSALPSSTHTVLWKWTGQTWTVLDSVGPPIRNLGGVAYDSRRNALVLFGGTYDQGTSYDDTWEWRPRGGWERKNVTGPGLRNHTDMVYDAEHQYVVLFGGQVGTDSFPADTWTWDGQSWRVATSGEPRSRVHHSLVYDPVSRRVLMFGGGSPGYGRLGDTWAWSGSAWSSAAGVVAPRSHARLGVTSRGVILFGGLTGGPILRLDAGQWIADDTPSAPGPRYLSAMAFDPTRRVTVLFGGGDVASDAILSDTWEYDATRGWRRFP